MMYQNQNQRTIQQNRALHKLFQMWADALNDASKDMFTVLKDTVEIPWGGNTVERYLWLPITEEQAGMEASYEELASQLSQHIEVDTLPSAQDIMQVKLKKGLRIYFKLVAEALNDAGHDMRVVLTPKTQVWWDKDTVKEFLWRPIQKARLGKISTTQLTTKEIDIIYDICNLHLGKHIDTIMFPSIEEIIIEQNYEKRNQ